MDTDAGKNGPLSRLHRLDAGTLAMLCAFYAAALLLIPLGRFADWIPPQEHSGYYSITRIDPADDTRLHSYARSMLIDGDIDFLNELGYFFRFRVTPTGYVYNTCYSVGSSLLWFPFLLAGHLLAIVLNAAGASFALNGYSPPYLIMTGIGSACYTFAGLMLLYSLLRDHFPKWLSALTVNVLFLSTHLPYYAFIRSRMAHANEFFAVSLYLYAWLRLRKQPSRLYSAVLLGSVCGLMTLIRVDTAPLTALCVGDALLLLFHDHRRRRTARLKRRIAWLIVLGLMFALVFSTALATAHVLWGRTTLVGDNFDYGSGPGDVFVNFFLRNLSLRRIGKLFLGYDKGILLSSPVWICAFAGMVLHLRKRPWPGLLIAAGACIPLGLCILNPSTGSAYGIRRLTASLPFLAVGLAAFYHAATPVRGGKILIVLVSCLLPLLSYVQLVQYKVILSYDDPFFVVKAIQNIPALLTVGHRFLLRSSCWPRLVLLDGAGLSSATDLLFLAGVPVLLLCSLGAIALLGAPGPRDSARVVLLRRGAVSSGLAVTVVFLFTALPVIVLLLNPPKPVSEINARRTYVESVKALEKQTGRSLIGMPEPMIRQRLRAFEAAPNIAVDAPE